MLAVLLPCVLWKEGCVFWISWWLRFSPCPWRKLDFLGENPKYVKANRRTVDFVLFRLAVLMGSGGAVFPWVGGGERWLIDIISREGRWRMKYSSLEILDARRMNDDQSKDTSASCPSLWGTALLLQPLCVHWQRRVCEESNWKPQIASHARKPCPAAVPLQIKSICRETFIAILLIFLAGHCKGEP